MDSFDEQLPYRVMNARPTAADTHYAHCVRLARTQLGISRPALALRTGVHSAFLAFLENDLLLPGELTPAVRSRLEGALGISAAAPQAR